MQHALQQYTTIIDVESYRAGILTFLLIPVFVTWLLETAPNVYAEVCDLHYPNGDDPQSGRVPGRKNTGGAHASRAGYKEGHVPRMPDRQELGMVSEKN